MHEGGLLKKFLWNSMDFTENVEQEQIGVTLEDVVPVLVLLASGIVLAIIILVFELCCYRRQKEIHDYHYQPHLTFSRRKRRRFIGHGVNKSNLISRKGTGLIY